MFSQNYVTDDDDIPVTDDNYVTDDDDSPVTDDYYVTVDCKNTFG